MWGGGESRRLDGNGSDHGVEKERVRAALRIWGGAPQPGLIVEPSLVVVPIRHGCLSRGEMTPGRRAEGMRGGDGPGVLRPNGTQRARDAIRQVGSVEVA